MEFAECSDFVFRAALEISSQELPGDTIPRHAIVDRLKLACDFRHTYLPKSFDCGYQMASGHVLQKSEHSVHHDLRVAINEQNNQVKRIG